MNVLSLPSTWMTFSPLVSEFGASRFRGTNSVSNCSIFTGNLQYERNKVDLQ